MPLSPTDLRDIHAVLGTASALVDRRRAIYSAVAELVGAWREADLTPDLLDSPAVRAHLAEVIVDIGRYRADALVPLSQLTTGAPTFVSGTSRTYVVGDPRVRVPLEPAVRHIGAELGRAVGSGGGIGLLLQDDPPFDAAADTAIEGLEIAVKLCPDLAEDLLPHVALLAIIRSSGTEHLGSASVRDYPGLIVVPLPGTAIEVAEALVHEGAHQKFFDIGTTRSLFTADFPRAPLFRASWSAASTPLWSLEQCAAAFHAYTCLATLHECVRTAGVAGSLHEFSLLPHAEVRSAELGEWVLSNQQYLGPDGRRTLAALAGRPDAADSEALADEAPRSEAPTVFRKCGSWTLVAQMAESVELYWVSTDGPFGGIGNS
jgi:hypothetical protein